MANVTTEAQGADGRAENLEVQPTGPRVERCPAPCPHPGAGAVPAARRAASRQSRRYPGAFRRRTRAIGPSRRDPEPGPNPGTKSVFTIHPLNPATFRPGRFMLARPRTESLMARRLALGLLLRFSSPSRRRSDVRRTAGIGAACVAAGEDRGREAQESELSSQIGRIRGESAPSRAGRRGLHAARHAPADLALQQELKRVPVKLSPGSRPISSIS